MQPPYTVEQLKLALMPVFIKNNVRRATLFGSYAKGKATPRSDVDLIDVQDIVPDSKIDQEIRHTGVVIYEQ